jgi:hypothetical protein
MHRRQQDKLHPPFMTTFCPSVGPNFHGNKPIRQLRYGNIQLVQYQRTTEPPPRQPFRFSNFPQGFLLRYPPRKK